MVNNLNKTDYKVLGVGHPRTGTGYTSKLLESFGLSIGHERLKDDGIVAWQMTMPLDKFGNKLPWVHPSMDYSKLNFDVIIYNTRNPKNSIPSIVFTETTSLVHRSKFIDFSDAQNDIEKAIISIVGFDKQIKNQYPKHIQYRVEDGQKKVYDFLSEKYELKSDYILPSSNYNSRKSRIGTINYEIVRPKYQDMINRFCIEYGYDKLFK